MVVAESHVQDFAVKGVDSFWLSPVCSHALDAVSTAKLPVSASSEEVEIVLLGQDASVTSSAGDFGDLLIELNLLW